MGITTVLNVFKRPSALVRQYEAIKAQTVPSSEILIWINRTDDDAINADVAELAASLAEEDPAVRVALNSHNYGVWSRFAFALNATNEYVCVFDDDTFPGARWYDNCLSQHAEAPGLYGTIGLLFLGTDYKKHARLGWATCIQGQRSLDERVEVDIVGHAWFFARELLSVFWRELPPPLATRRVGEDMHFSHMVQKYSGLKTYVPPHPLDQPELWGSTDPYAFGADDNALWRTPAGDEMCRFLERCLHRGYSPLGIANPQYTASLLHKYFQRPTP